MKTLLKLTILGMLLPVLSAMAFAQTGPQSIYIDCDNSSGSQSDLKRPRGDGNVWVFQIIPGEDVHWVEGPNWSYPGKGGADPSWGQWGGGDGSLSLSWISPEHSGAFSIGVTGKITCGSGGDGGAPIDISALWSGEVTPKEWKAEPAITGGEVTQPADTDAENPKEVGPGEVVNLAVGEATDQDTWTEGEETGQEADTVHYKWTSGNGGFVTEDNPDGDATEVTIQSAQWKAPVEPGDYTVTCEIDDEPAAVEEPDTGDRDDDPVTRTVHIKVVVGESSATLKLYKDAELTEEATGTIGGSVYVVLEVKLGKYQKLVSNNATLRIEENYEEHSETERRWDRTVSFDSGWQKKGANDEWQVTTETPQSKNTSGDEKYFRKVWSWATYSQPLGHNEQHTVEIVKVDDGEDTELSFTPTNEGDDGKNGPEPVDADVANLVITDVSTNSGNPNYFLFNSSSTDQSITNPSITFSFKNDGDTTSSHNRYHWWLFIRATDQTNFAVYEGDMNAPGDKTVPISPSDLQQEGVGTYAFEIHVKDTKTGDWLGNLSKHLELASHSFELVNNPSADLEAQISYQIASDRDAQELTVDFFNPSLDKLTSYDGGTERNHLYEDISLYTFTDDDQGGTYTAVFTAKDDFADAYRDHQSRGMLALNKKGNLTPFNVWRDGATWGSLMDNTKDTPINLAYISACFNNIGIKILYQPKTTGDLGTGYGGWTIKYQALNQTQQKVAGHTVIMGEFQGSGSGRGLDGLLGVLIPYKNTIGLSYWSMPPDKPGLAFISPLKAKLLYQKGGLEDWDNAQVGRLLTNTMAHELTHALARGWHCGEWYDDSPSQTCLIHDETTSYWDKNLADFHYFWYKGSKYHIPWHSKYEVNQMRWQLNLSDLNIQISNTQ